MSEIAAALQQLSATLLEIASTINKQEQTVTEDFVEEKITSMLDDYDPTDFMGFEDAVRDAVRGMSVSINLDVEGEIE